MIANLEKQGIKVSDNGEGASYTPVELNGKTIDHQITHGPTTKKWELLEEYAHHRVELGWKKKEMEELTKQLKKGRRKLLGGGMAQNQGSWQGRRGNNRQPAFV